MRTVTVEFFCGEKRIWQVLKKLFYGAMNFTHLCSQCSALDGCGSCVPSDRSELEMFKKIATTIRGLVMDMVSAAKSGHLGMALGCAEIGAVLFGKYLRCNPVRPRWIDRDRFVLSAGHGSAFLYACLHLSGHAISLDDLAQFRQGNGKTTGHPEFNLDCGIECSSGPLGQGVANAVGMALARKKLKARLGSSASLLRGKVICLAGDGCLQEGVALEAISLAGHWKLEDLILIYDANGTTLDGSLSRSQSQPVADLFLDLGWGVQEIDGHDCDAIVRAYGRARIAGGKPQLILARTVIGKGIPAIEGSSAAHGFESGLAEIGKAKIALGIEGNFCPSDEVQQYMRTLGLQRQHDYELWFYDYENELKKNPSAAILFEDDPLSGADLLANFPAFSTEVLATREAVGQILNHVGGRDDRLLSASADLFASARNYLDGGGDFSSTNSEGRNLEFGVREHAMGAVLNGLAYEGTFRPIGSTFLAFADYLRPALRMGALAQLPVGLILTHDSPMVGPDGPTHQPVEALPALRLIPNLDVFRPADGEEAVAAIGHWIDRRDGPTVLVLSRQPLPFLSHLTGEERRQGARRGAYVVWYERSELKLVLLATGSEVSLCCRVAEDFPSCRVVSMPSREVFERQGPLYRREILPLDRSGIMVVEAARAAGWEGYGSETVSVETYGRSMDGRQLMAEMGFSLEALRARVAQRLAELNGQA